MKPSVFIGSSTGDLTIAYAIQAELANDAEGTVWKQGVFKPMADALDSLLCQLLQSDFGVFVFAPSDALKIGDREMVAVRDNVVFECGLFLGALGRERVFVFVPKGRTDLRILSDLQGVMFCEYEPHRRDGNWQAATGPACNQVRQAIQPYGFKRQACPTIDRWAAIVRERHQEDIHPYTFCGVNIAEASNPANVPITDYTAVYGLWADANHAGNLIQAVVAHEKGRKFFRVTFRNQTAFPPSVSFRPCGLAPLVNPQNARYLLFQARARKGAELNADGAAIGVSVRLVDRAGTHWSAQFKDIYIIHEIPVDDQWHEMAVELTSTNWQMFASNGNHLYATERPDFSVIPAVVVEFGSPSPPRPGPCNGEVDIKDFRLGDSRKAKVSAGGKKGAVRR